MAPATSPSKKTTPPKGRPTRARNSRRRDSRLFGATFQWIAAAVLLVVVFVILFLVLDGGNFNPFDDDTAQGAAVVAGTTEAVTTPMSQPVNDATF